MQSAAAGAGFPYLRGKAPFIGKAPYSDKPYISFDTWKLSDCDNTHFPLQAHHLIPKNHLSKNAVCAFLAKAYTAHADYVLVADAPYSNDHANNGCCLPYASALTDWGKATNSEQKDEIANKLMNVTGRQLHQGSHRNTQYQPESAAAEEDPGTALPGYLARVDQLLYAVGAAQMVHLERCLICNPNMKSAGKKKILPRLKTVNHMDQVSSLLKIIMEANRIFVSKRASKHFNTQQELTAPDWLAKKE
jgi:hypothetical protein